MWFAGERFPPCSLGVSDDAAMRRGIELVWYRRSYGRLPDRGYVGKIKVVLGKVGSNAACACPRRQIRLYPCNLRYRVAVVVTMED
jgi:hypothetical protein